MAVSNTISYINKYLELKDSTIFIYYEDLVEKTADTLQNLFNKIGYPKVKFEVNNLIGADGKPYVESRLA